MIVQQMLRNELWERCLSIRAAAREMGISHTSLIRIIDGKPSDLETLAKVSTWLGVGLTTLIDIPVEGSDLFVSRIRAVCDYHPALKIALEGLMERIETGQLDITITDDIAAYIEFRSSPRS